MKVEQRQWHKTGGWAPHSGELSDSANLVFLFGSRSVIGNQDLIEQVKAFYPKACLFGCSTAGEIFETEVFDDSLVVTAVVFEHTKVKGNKVLIDDSKDSFRVGAELAQSLTDEKLTHVLVLSDGLKVNGSELVKGITQNLPENVVVTGGMAGDGELFETTLVLLDEVVETGMVAAVGFYGERLKIGCSSLGGWDQFGPERLITKSKGNVLYELDGKSALGLYKTYLGEHADKLPASALLFPLGIRSFEDDRTIVRAIMGINEDEQSMTFAGDVPEGQYARLMKANFDRLIDGAVEAAEMSRNTTISSAPELALLVSCCARKAILKQRIEEEVEGVREVFGDKTCLAGFYSYGEISPFTPNAKCELHNQTMVITTFLEV